MHYLLFILLLIIPTAFRPIGSVQQQTSDSPLSAFSDEWNKPAYAVCNTAANAAYLSNPEKKAVYILNLARMNPPLFAKTVVRAYPNYSGEQELVQSEYYKSLLLFLQKKTPMPLLQPDRSLFESAHCHAETSGQTGYVGHERRTKSCKDLQTYSGECCQYGYQDPLSIVMELLIDEGVPSLGHRIILFKPHTQIGISIQPHKRYRWNTVINLG